MKVVSDFLFDIVKVTTKVGILYFDHPVQYKLLYM